MTTEIVYGQTLALWLGNGDEYCPLESDMAGLNVKGNLYLYLDLFIFTHSLFMELTWWKTRQILLF